MEDKVKLNFLAGVQVGNEIYFSSWDTNGLFKYNPALDQCDFLKIFPGEENVGIHSGAILHKNTIWFIPRASERIAIVDLDSLDITYLDLPESGHRPKGNIPPIRMRGYYISEENFLYLIPFAYKLFLKIDMEKREIMNVENWGGDEYAYAVGVRLQDKLSVYINNYNEMREIDLKSGKYTIKNIGDKGTTYTGIQRIGETILLFPVCLKDGIVLFNINDGQTRTIQLDDEKQWYYEYQALTKENDILLIPYNGKKSVRISIENDCCYIKEIQDLEVKEDAYCSAKLLYNDEIWYLSHFLENPIIFYANDTIQYRYIEINRKKHNEQVMKSLAEYGSAYNPLSNGKDADEQYLLLDTFLQLIKEKKSGENIGTSNRAGVAIYESIT